MSEPSGETLTETLTETPGATPGDAPGETPNEASGETQSETPGKAPTESKTPTETPTERPGRTQSKAPGETPGKKPLNSLDKGVESCCMCRVLLEPLPTGPTGWRICDECMPRPHRVTMTYVPRLEIYIVGFLAEDAKTSLGWPYTVRGEAALRSIVERGHGDLEDFDNQQEVWGQGCIDLHLTHKQYLSLVRERHNPLL